MSPTIVPKKCGTKQPQQLVAAEQELMAARTKLLEAVKQMKQVNTRLEEVLRERDKWPSEE